MSLKDKKRIKLREISKQYSIPLSTARRWASERRFPLYRVSNRIYVSPEEFESWLQKYKIEATESGGVPNDSE